MLFEGVFEVISIEEDLDFGCEEREEGAQVMAIVTLRGENGEEMCVRHADKVLYEKEINEGDSVRFIGGELEHAKRGE